MATRNDRDVRLGVEITATGEASLLGLGDAVRGLGDAAGDSTPDLQRLRTDLEALTATTEARRRAEAAARTDATAARAAFDQQRDALARLRAESDRATRGTTEHQAAERGLRVAVTEARIALRERTAAVTAASAETRAERTLQDAIRQTAAAARASSQVQVQSLTPVASAVQSLTAQLGTLRNIAGAALGGTLIGGLARDVAETADAYNNLAARIRITTGEGAAFEAAFQGIFDIANRTGVAVEEVGRLFTKLAAAGRALNLSNADALALVESITQATALSGASASSSAAAITQFSQALSSGVLRGEELNSVLEQAPRLSQALADGLGITTGRLRELGAAGALTAQQVITALQGQSATLQREFDQLPPTVGRAIAALSNAWTVYVGQVDRATGASSAAASVIGALASNLDIVAAALFSVGKAAAAYAALRLAQSFIDSATAARTVAAATAAATAATTAHTAATVANTAAQGANTAAAAGSAAGAGRLAGVLSTLKTLSFLGVVTNLREIGTAIGEGTAKLLGYGKAEQELEIVTRASEQAARASAQARTELAQRTALSADAALGLTDASRKVIAEFDGMVSKGESASDALGKLAKALDLGDISGIIAAGAALDALAVRGALSAEQVRSAYVRALRDIDLGTFEAQARAAFDGSEQGARRLAAAVDATLAEALRRAGTSAEELSTGFSRAATSALNDFDKLADNLDKLGGTAEDVGRVLGTSLDKALSAATTERAVRAVIERMEDLGKQGRITGDQLAEGLDKARRKLDELKPGVSSLEEAFRTLG